MIVSRPRTLMYVTSPICTENPMSIGSRQRARAEMSKREPTVLSIPCTKLLLNVSSRYVEEITHDGIAFRTRRQVRTRGQSSQAHEGGTPKDHRGQGDVWVVVHHVKDRGDRFHLLASRRDGRGRDGRWLGQRELSNVSIILYTYSENHIKREERPVTRSSLSS